MTRAAKRAADRTPIALVVKAAGSAYGLGTVLDGLALRLPR